MSAEHTGGTTRQQGVAGILKGKVAVVAGATRGAGRGIARGLGEAGAIVYCTGRSVAGSPSPYGRTETVDETAALITAAGGTAVAVRVDHGDEEQVGGLFARVAAEQCRLDVLVNSIAGEDPRLGPWQPFWKLDLSESVAALGNAILTHLITAKHAAPAMIEQGAGLIVEVTEGDLPGGAGGNALSSLVRACNKDLAARMAWELGEHGVAAVAITPGFLRSETMLDHFGVTEANWRDGATKDEHFLQSESPLFVGRAVAALAADPEVLRHSGQITSSWELARVHGFTDADGRRPDWGPYFATILPTLGSFVDGMRQQLAFYERAASVTRGYLVNAEHGGA